MTNKWLNPPPSPKVEGELNFDNPPSIDYSPADVWNTICAQVGKKKSKRKNKGLKDTRR